MLRSSILGILYAVLYWWHNRPLAQPLSSEEVSARFRQMTEWSDEMTRHLGKESRERLQNFLETDDGRPFYMVNLMQYRERACYPDGFHPDVRTGAEANTIYGRSVLPELLKRGSYPVFLSSKHTNFLNAGSGTDFFEEVAIVRYRSRRDLLEMITSDSFRRAETHKWASLVQTVVVPTRRMLPLDPGTLLPLLPLLFWLLSGPRDVPRK